MRRKISESNRKKVYDMYEGHCAYCGRELKYKDMQVDHVNPISKGGANELSNMLPACQICNNYKYNSTIEEFRKYLAGIAHKLMEKNTSFQVAIRYGTVKYMGDNVTFYFERSVSGYGRNFIQRENRKMIGAED